MKELIKAIVTGMYDYYSKSFCIKSYAHNPWEVKIVVEINGKIMEEVTVDEWDAYAKNSTAFIDNFESAIEDTFERLKAKYILNHHHRLSA